MLLLGKYGNWLKIEEDFLPLVGTDAMLSTSVQCSIFSHHEQFCTGTYGVAAKQHVMSKFRNEIVLAIDFRNAAKSRAFPRSNKEACFMVLVGKKEKNRDA